MRLRPRLGTLLALVIGTPLVVLTGGMAAIDMTSVHERKARTEQVAARFPEAAQAIATINQARAPKEVPILVSCGFGLGLLASLILTSRMRAQVGRLSQAAADIAGGELERVVPAQYGPVELRSLAAALEHMRGELLALLRVTRENAQREANLAVAATLAKLTLPRTPSDELGPLRVSGSSRPAEQAGGDWWSYEKCPDGSLIVLLGDVSGHGVPSAIVVTAAATAYEVLKQRGLLSDIPALLEELNRALLATCRGRFHMTLSVVRVDPTQARAELWNAGGVPTLHVDATGAAHPLTVPGTPLGVDALRLGNQVVPFGPGERLLLLSDGILDARGADGRPLGLKRLCELVRRHAHSQGAAQLTRAIHGATDAAPEDDRTFALVDWPADGHQA